MTFAVAVKRESFGLREPHLPTKIAAFPGAAFSKEAT
jgi:hypothetical protein